MSFNKLHDLESQPTNIISRRIFQITSNITQIQRLLQAISSKKDNQQSRSSLHTLLETTRDNVKAAGDDIKKLDDFDERQIGGDAAKFTKNKMKRDFQSALSSFQDVQRKSAEYQKSYVDTAKQVIQESEEATANEDSDARVQLQATQTPRLLDNAEIEFNESLIEERESEIQNIEAGITELNEIFRDLGTMVSEQGNQIDSIEANVDNVATNTQVASTELSKAQRYQRNSRNRMFCLMMILIIIFTIVLLAVVLG
ncbi:protein of unknown function [Taphrina deformans PYCC 5710]|uniref:t-SNARE coiled-coil homology domain-containing protein n=1 Tax=Taphrina deformans (strain PYCC 5710 / ATCC 11124 / CBS 356.35 / IMI 108563 / JCM 9778 / NBRC 8474) TaxID=1097556 RepID=R4XJC1_TAPDE|nr:protein of unknown function [Taphrina deformans PYCC 5710]|eukprot:CCG84564.1 protein of unknown function [Taphrina deformans PYCC 5710]